MKIVETMKQPSGVQDMIGGYSAQEAEGLNERMAAINLRDEQTRQMN